ncbi:LLM class flavin-dependent oxidoreductase [Actinoplanes sp. CA-054009]
MTTLGVLFMPDRPLETLLGVAREADRAGLAELWITEDCFLNGGIAAASAVLAGTERLAVGLGVLPVPLRNVALCAMEIATMRHLFGERALFGVGHGVQEWMGQVGARPSSPLTLMREYAVALGGLLRGETVTVAGRYVTLDGVALDRPPRPAPRLMVGATGPKSLALSGEVGEGTILAGGVTAAGVRAAMGHIAPGPGHEIVVFLEAAPAGDAAGLASVIREYVAAGATKVVLEQAKGDAAGFVRFVAEELQPLVN